MLTAELQVHAAAEQLPDADTDVLIFFNGFYPAELGAYIGHEEDGSPMWVDAQGGNVYGVKYWAELPWLPGAKAEEAAPAAQPSTGRWLCNACGHRTDTLAPDGNGDACAHCPMCGSEDVALVAPNT